MMINLDFDASNRLLGVEILDASPVLPPELLRLRTVSRRFGAAPCTLVGLDRSGSYDDIRGREQQLIEHYRERGVSAIKINEISPSHPRLQWDLEPAFGEFGP